jgi:hypothetical protein
VVRSERSFMIVKMKSGWCLERDLKYRLGAKKEQEDEAK